MHLKQLRDYITHIAPVQPDPEWTEQLLLQSSQIVFERKHEVLFKSGDPALGVYWILAGEARIEIDRDHSIIRGPGDMIGLDAYLAQERIDFPSYGMSPTLVTLFLDRVGLSLFQKEASWSAFLQEQLVDLLRAYKSQIYRFPQLTL